MIEDLTDLELFVHRLNARARAGELDPEDAREVKELAEDMKTARLLAYYDREQMGRMLIRGCG